MAINLKKDSSSKKWYYSKDGYQFGPFNESELLKHIDAKTLVWSEGMDWTTVCLVEEFRHYFNAPFESSSFSDNNESKLDDIHLDTMPDFKGKNMFSSSFSFKGRIRRTEYVLSFIIYIIANALISAVSKEMTVVGVLQIINVWFLIAQGAKRCHDRNNSGWFQIVPFYVIWMFFAEGDKTVNYYGANPK
jgi:hypothetical protein